LHKGTSYSQVGNMQFGKNMLHISEVLPENCSSIEAGDIICSVDDIVLYSLSQVLLLMFVCSTSVCHLRS
jgi:hypothetical protein